MDVHDTLAGMLQTLGTRAGLGPLSFDETGVCALQVGGSVVHLYAEPGSDAAMIYVPVGGVPAAQHARLLEANFIEGPGMLALDARSGSAMVVARPVLNGMPMTAFEGLIAGLAATADRWRTDLAGEAPAPSTPAEPEMFAASMIRG